MSAELQEPLPACQDPVMLALELHCGREKELKEVATELGVSYATVRRYHAGVIGRLAARLRAAGVHEAPAK